MDKKRMLTTAMYILAGLLVLNIIGILLLSFTAKDSSSGPAAVDALIIGAPCPECFNMSLLLPQLEEMGVALGDVRHVAHDSRAGEAAIEEYGLTRLPALVLAEEFAAYPDISGSWDRVGRVAGDGSYLLEGMPPPYYAVETGEIHGIVDVIYLTDASCEGCYDVTMHRDPLERFGVAIGKETTYDISSREGQALIAEYEVVRVPTVLLQGELGLYAGFDDVWRAVGTVADDGTYIFVNLAALEAPYRDLASGLVVTPG